LIRLHDENSRPKRPGAPSAGGASRAATPCQRLPERSAALPAGARTAHGRWQPRIAMLGSHRLGSTARPGVVLQGEAAVDRGQVEATLLYTRTTGPLKNRHARTLAEEAAANGVRL